MEKRRSYKPGDYSLRPRRSSAGIGLFTEDPIAKGKCVIEYVGRVLEKGEELTSNSRYLFEVSSKKTLDGKPRINKAGYINHSCRPNCEALIYSNRVYIFSRRAIKAGEELTYDYGKEYFNEYCKPHGCRCVKCKA